jgi:hypothetical protein
MRRLFCIAVGVVVAAVFSQEPEFLQQYAQRLGGQIDVLSRQAREFDDMASRSGLTRKEALDRFKANPEIMVASEGARKEADFEWLARLLLDQHELRAGTEISRFGKFLWHLDPTIAAGTLAEFVPAVPLSISGGIFGLAGLVFGLALGVFLTIVPGFFDRWLFGPKGRLPHFENFRRKQ